MMITWFQFRDKYCWFLFKSLSILFQSLLLYRNNVVLNWFTVSDSVYTAENLIIDLPQIDICIIVSQFLIADTIIVLSQCCLLYGPVRVNCDCLRLWPNIYIYRQLLNEFSKLRHYCSFGFLLFGQV